MKLFRPRATKTSQVTVDADIAMNAYKLTGLGAGLASGHSLRYEQVVGVFLPLAGGTMSGAIAMGSQKITGLAAGAASGDALRYEQVVGVFLPLAGGTMTGDINLAARKLKTTNALLQEVVGGGLGVRDIDDTVYYPLDVSNLKFSTSLQATADALTINAKNAASNYVMFKARGASALEEIARLVGHTANPYFQATLPMVLKPASEPGTPVEGHFWYDATLDKIEFRDATATRTIVDERAFPNLTTIINTTWAGAAQGASSEVDRRAQINGKGVARITFTGDGYVSTKSRIYIDGTVVWEVAGNVALEVSIQFLTSLKVTTYNPEVGAANISGGSVLGNYGS